MKLYNTALITLAFAIKSEKKKAVPTPFSPAFNS